jgi:hypothetical protein
MVVGTDPFSIFYVCMHASVWFQAWGFQTPDQDLNSLGANCFIYLYLYNRFHLLLHNSGNEIVFFFLKNHEKNLVAHNSEKFSPLCILFHQFVP